MAVDATGTVTSPDSIPTYNTAADNPSGKGLNNIVAAIQTALSARVNKPSGVATGDVPVWNGTTWVVPGGSRTGAKFLRDDGTWQLPAGVTTYRKNTVKAVNTTVAATDLLNGEITVAANVLGSSGVLRLTAWGDRLDNVGASTPRLQLIFGGTTFIDTNAGNGGVATAARFGWKLVAEIQNVDTTHQTVNFRFDTWNANIPGTQGVIAVTTGAGYHSYRSEQVIVEASNSGLNVDTTAAKTLVLNVINGSASASYETKLFGALVEVI